MNKKRLVLIALLLIIFWIGALVIFWGRDSSRDTNESNIDTRGSTTIPNINQYATEAKIDDVTQLEQYIWDIVKINVPDAKKNYTVTVRDNSLTKSTSTNGYPKTAFLVDIPDLKRTFRVETEGSPELDYHTVYVLCPAETELLYGAIDCKDQAQ